MHYYQHKNLGSGDCVPNDSQPRSWQRQCQIQHISDVILSESLNERILRYLRSIAWPRDPGLFPLRHISQLLHKIRVHSTYVVTSEYISSGPDSRTPPLPSWFPYLRPVLGSGAGPLSWTATIITLGTEQEVRRTFLSENLESCHWKRRQLDSDINLKSFFRHYLQRMEHSVLFTLRQFNQPHNYQDMIDPAKNWSSYG